MLPFPTFLMDTFLIDEWNSNQYINAIDSLLLKVFKKISPYLLSLLQGVPVFRNFSIRGPTILWFISDTNFVNRHFVFCQWLQMKLIFCFLTSSYVCLNCLATFHRIELILQQHKKAWFAYFVQTSSFLLSTSKSELLGPR